MEKTAWLVTKDGFQRVKLLEETERVRRVRVEGGGRDGQVLALPPEGMPHGQFNPALYVGEEPPEIWRCKGRSLPLVKHADFGNPEQAKALVPIKETYVFTFNAAKVVDGVLAGDHQLLFGPTGVGKTSLVLQIAARIGQPVIRLNFNGQVSVSDLVGSVGFGSGGTTWNDGALPRAMRQGYWLVLDELDFGSPDILSILYPVLEPRPRLCLKEHDGEVVEADPRFRVFATGNGVAGDQDGVYAGTQALNAALLNRFTGHGQAIRIEPMTPKQEREVLMARLPGLSNALAKRACDLANRLRNGDGQNPALLPTFSTRELVQFARKLLAYRDPVQAAGLTFLSVVRDANVRQPVEQCLGLIFGRRVIVGRPRMNGATRPPLNRKHGKPATTPKPAASREGRVASAVTDAKEIEAIWSAYKGNGGALSYKQIEDDPKFDLRKANGNTAYRICRRHGAATKGASGEDAAAK